MSEFRVLYLDGLGCNPEGFKPRYIRSLGYDVLAPMLPDLDFPASECVAAQALQTYRPDVIVGYSRGGSVALALMDDRVPRLLIAPALHWVAEGRLFSGRLVVLHSAYDDGLPLEAVREQVARCGMPAVAVRVVGNDHTMIDPDALAAMAVALVELTEGTELRR